MNTKEVYLDQYTYEHLPQAIALLDSDEWLQLFHPPVYPSEHEEIQKLVQYVIEKGGIDYAVEVMNDYYSRAQELIDYFPNEAIRPALTAYLDYVINRTK